MKPTTENNWTEPGSDSFDQIHVDSGSSGACVYCGDYDPEFREHFLSNYAASGGEYGRYAAAYELGHQYRHQHDSGEWTDVESELRREWESRGQGPWDDFKDAVKHGWSRHKKPEIAPTGW